MVFCTGKMVWSVFFTGTSLYVVGLISDHTSIYLGFAIIICGKFVLGWLYSRLAKNMINNAEKGKAKWHG